MTDRPDVRSVEIQCDLLAVPPLKKLSRKDADVSHETKAESIASDHDSAAEDTDLDTSFHIIQENPVTW